MVVIFLCTLATAEAANNPLEELFDNQFEGFFMEAGIGYGITSLEGSSDRSTAGETQWKLGYAISEQTGFYVTSIFTDLEVQFGVMHFYNLRQRNYVTVSIGYYSHSSEVHDWGIGSDTLAFTFGLGYEFRQHLAVEGTAGYQQRKFSTPTSLSSSINRTQYTFVASINYLFY